MRLADRTSDTSDTSESARALLGRFSLEMTAKDVASLCRAAQSGAIPPQTPINITYLAGEDDEDRITAARTARELGLLPVPHIAARRLSGETELRRLLDALQTVDATERVFVVGGDPEQPEGPFPDALRVIESGMLEQYGVRSVGIAGYPEGHPNIGDDVLWQALNGKLQALAHRELEATVVTQFAFDAAPVLAWVAAARERGLSTPIRIGIPGPTTVRRLLGYARRFGVGTGAEVVRKYGFSLTNLLGSTGPERLLGALADEYDPVRHGELDTHFYAFGGLQETADWVREFRQGEEKGN